MEEFVDDQWYTFSREAVPPEPTSWPTNVDPLAKYTAPGYSGWSETMEPLLAIPLVHVSCPVVGFTERTCPEADAAELGHVYVMPPSDRVEPNVAAPCMDVAPSMESPPLALNWPVTFTSSLNWNRSSVLPHVMVSFVVSDPKVSTALLLSASSLSVIFPSVTTAPEELMEPVVAISSLSSKRSPVLPHVIVSFVVSDPNVSTALLLSASSLMVRFPSVTTAPETESVLALQITRLPGPHARLWLTN